MRIRVREMKKRHHIMKEHKEKLRKKHAVHMPRYLPTMEESHGFLAIDPSPEDPLPIRQKKRKQRPIWIKQLMIAMIFFVIFTFLLTQSTEDTNIREWIYYALDEDFPFAATYDWYEENIHRLDLFVSPSVNKETEEVSFILDDVVETFQSTGTRMSVAPKSKIDIPALADGIVVFSGKDHNTNLTVVVQQDDRSKVVYGNLSKINIPLYKRVRKQDIIGSFQPSSSEDAYSLSIMKDGKFVDPYLFIAEKQE